MIWNALELAPIPSRPFTDDELYELCAVNPELQVERDEHGKLIIMAPTGGLSGNSNGQLLFSVEMWNRLKGRPGITFDSSTGFLLPDGSLRSPDLAWMEIGRWNTLSKADKERFVPLCPDFVCEVKSPTDSLPVLMKKMNAYMANGARLGWLVDPEQRQGWMYLPGMEPEQVHGPGAELSGKDVLPGLIYCLDDLK